MNFNDIIKNSSKLMAMEKSGEISRKFGKNNKTQMLDDHVSIQENIIEKNINIKPIETTQVKISQNSKLPKEIVDSFRKSLMEEEQKNMEMMKIVADNQKKDIALINEDSRESLITEKKDIKDLIKEAIREEISSLKILSLKDKINLITNNGDVYEVKLTYKKNINKKN